MAIDEELREKMAEAVDLGFDAGFGGISPTTGEMAEVMIEQLERAGERVSPEYLRNLASQQREMADEFERIAAQREGH